MRGCFVSISQPGAGPAAASCPWGWHWHWNRSPEVLCCQKMQLPSASRGVTQVRHLHTTALTSAADTALPQRWIWTRPQDLQGTKHVRWNSAFL